jgi:hypothetical protein
MHSLLSHTALPHVPAAVVNVVFTELSRASAVAVTTVRKDVHIGVSTRGRSWLPSLALLAMCGMG